MFFKPFLCKTQTFSNSLSILSLLQLRKFHQSFLLNLFSIIRQSGAVGSRLTGAGWGGCAVSMVPSSQVKQFLEKVKQGYYVPRGLESVVAEALFATQPGDGAAIYLPS